eukprot:374511_1
MTLDDIRDTEMISGLQKSKKVHKVYQFLGGSKKPLAKLFQDWIYEEVVPSIRKTGSYSMKPKIEVDANNDLIRKKLVLELNNTNINSTTTQLQRVNDLKKTEMNGSDILFLSAMIRNKAKYTEKSIINMPQQKSISTKSIEYK